MVIATDLKHNYYYTHRHIHMHEDTHASYLCVESLLIGLIHQTRHALIVTISIFTSVYRLPTP